MSDVPVTCPECSSENVMFSKKRQVYVCEDCGHEFTVETPFVPKRVFISYGHDEHIVLAVKLRDDLKAQGHLPWFDGDRLPPGQDWERNIEEGLAWAAADKTNGAVALLMTPHSVRRPKGYCLNEVARALNLGLRIIPMMVVDSEPPLSICRIQWLDLRPCIPISQKEALYQPRFERFLEALMNPTLDFEGNQQRLLKALQPLDFDADILFHLKSFVGREWVFREIDAWLKQPDAQRVFWIAGAPGVGKTAICAWLSSRYLEIGAMHLCKFGHRQKADPAKVVASLAYQLTTQLPEYEAVLMAKDIGALALDDARTMFDNLIVQPLSKLSKPKRPVALLIDALDEATHDGQNALAGFIAAEFPKTPDWLRLIITSRPEPEVTGPLQRLTPFVLDTACQDNINDIRNYIEQQLENELQGRPDADAIVQTILDRSEYVFLYVQRVCQDVLDGALSLDAMDQFPKGLGEAYWQFFERQFGNTDDDKTRLDRYKDRVRPALRAILAAREPLPVAVLQGLFQWCDEELNDFTIALGSLFPVSGGEGAETIKPYHKAIGDWLGDKTRSGAYFVSIEEGAKRLAEQGWKNYQEQGPDKMPPYFLRHLPAHLSEAGRVEDLVTLLKDLAFLEAKVVAGLAFDLPLDFAEVLKVMPHDHDQHRILTLLDEAVRRDIHFIARHAEDYPQALFQCLWNSGWWYDCPEAARHYIEPEGGWTETPPLGQDVDDKKNTEPKLFILLEHWRQKRVNSKGPFAWIKSHRPPRIQLGISQKDVLLGHTGPVRSIALTADGTRIISGSRDCTIRIWNAATGACLSIFSGHTNWVSSVAVSPDDRYIISGSWDNTIRVWDFNTGFCLHILNGHTNFIESVGFSPDGACIVSASSDKTICVWDVHTGIRLHIFEGHTDRVKSVSFSPDGSHIVSGSRDCTVRIWRLVDCNYLLTLQGHTDSVWSVAFSPDGTRVVSGSDDRTIRVWDASSGTCLKILEGHLDWVKSVIFSPAGNIILSGSDDKTIRLWDASSGVCLQTIEGHDGGVNCAVFNLDGIHILSGSDDKTIRFWLTLGGLSPNTLKEHTGQILSTAFSVDGTRLVSGSVDKTIRLWDSKQGICLNTLKGHKGEVKSVSFNSNGLFLVSGGGSNDNTVRVWDVITGDCICILDGHKGGVNSVAFSPDDNLIVSGSDDTTIRIWNVKHRLCQRALTGHTREVTTITLSRDGKRILSGSADKTIRIWDPISGTCLRVLKGHNDWVYSVIFNLECSQIISRAWDRTMRIWDVETGTCLRVIKESGGIANIGSASKSHPYRTLCSESETVISDTVLNTPAAWFSEGINFVNNCPNFMIWAGSNQNHLFIIQMVGNK